ncbi:kinesin-like protein KIN-10C [Macadamia integrifolia]|uniref:kinesin-like protein KIN-10C n=1 Tax=Macadamia integrifolia TaxID=60698 RepID=UPI001C4F2CBD|nr:kinesin-like protein KIN-10C [Macadamia integrifolia]
MASSSTPDSIRSKAISASDSRQRVRIVGKIRPFSDSEIESSGGSPNPSIFLQKPEPESSERVAISFSDQLTSRKESFKLDYCYAQDEDVGQIFAREVKPIVSGIFRGLNASVLVYGARGSGKTYTIQGSNEKPGLVPMAMAEILTSCDEIGSSVTISCYEVYQDHVYDVLEPKEVTIFEDNGGRIILKGLSQVPVKSISEFHELYFHRCTSWKPSQKPTNDALYRSHKGLIIDLSCNDKNPNARCLGKINFVDLAGHESTRMSKSLYALQNVVYALNANERVPYRESKLTRMLQESLGKPSQNLIVTCLNPHCCQDTINVVSWASRSCLVLNRICPDSTKKTKTGGRSMVFCTPKAGKSQNSTTSTQKHNTSQLKLIEKKNNGVSAATEGRKLFDGAHSTINSEQEFSLSTNTHAVESSIVNENDQSLPERSIGSEWNAKALVVAGEKRNDSINEVSNIYETKGDVEKENKSKIEDASPPLTARIRELSNSLKALSSSTALNIKMPLGGCHSSKNEVGTDVVEPKTPRIEQSGRSNDNLEIAVTGTPRETFNLCSSGLKISLVQEFLKFLNTANKEELKGMKGIGEKRANYILQLRDRSPEPFKDLSDLKSIGLAMKQINAMIRNVAGELFN